MNNQSYRERDTVPKMLMNGVLSQTFRVCYVLVLFCCVIVLCRHHLLYFWKKKKQGSQEIVSKQNKTKKISEEERKSRKMFPLVGVVGYIKEKTYFRQ